MREILVEVQVPTLAVDRPAAKQFDSRHTRYLAEHIPSAQLLELPRRGYGTAGRRRRGARRCDRESSSAGTDARADTSRSLATVAFTDIVGSTAKAAALGDTAWRELLGRHDQLTRELVGSHNGKPVKSTGARPSRNLRRTGSARSCCVSVLADQVRPLGIELRAGASHRRDRAARQRHRWNCRAHRSPDRGSAGPEEALASSTVRDLAAGSGIEFADRGRHELKGVPDSWQLVLGSQARPR